MSQPHKAEPLRKAWSGSPALKALRHLAMSQKTPAQIAANRRKPTPEAQEVHHGYKDGESH